MTYKVLMALLVSLHLMKIVIGVTSKPDQTASEEITLFKLTNPLESKSVTENPCKGLNEGSDIALVLTNRNLVDFPVCLPKNIEILDLSINNLTIIQERDISELSNLLILRLKYNQIRNIYWSTEVLTKLLQLDLSYNYISTVPKCIMLKEMKWLSLAGNPISQIHPFAFSCFPNLQFLNLSSTLLGNISSESISESAFALNVAGKKESRTSLDLLDLSGTFLSRGNSLWSKDIPNLKKLFIMNMIYMESLEEDLLKSFPQLQSLICSGSNALNSVASEVFENAPNLRYLDFQNCNLSTLSLWNISVANISINLQGNPLNCSCELSWVFSDHVSLISANETFCSIASGGQPLFSVIDQCNFNVKTNVTDNQTRTETTIGPHNSAITTTTANYLQGTSKQDVLNILSSQEGDQIAFIPGSIKVSKTTGNSDSTTPLPSYLSTTSAIWQTSTHIGNAVQNITDDTKLSTTVGVSAVKVSTTIPPITKHQSLPITAMVHHTTQFNKEPANKGSPSYEDIPIEFDSDYNYEDEQQSKTTVKKQIVSCNYHPCRHLQTPCFELQQLTECYCPGLSGEDIIPDPPRLRDVSEVTDTSVQIKWCAPSSVVEKYRIVYHPEGSRNHTVIDNIYVTTRLYSLYKLLPHTTYQVCVIAVNKRGSSDTTNDNLSRIPCTTFTTKPNYVVIMAALSAVGGLLLVTIIVLSVCLYKTCKSNMVNQYDTHLVSYKNPAFDYQLNIPTYH